MQRTAGTAIYMGGVPGVIGDFKVSTTLAIAPLSLTLALVFTIVGGAAKEFEHLLWHVLLPGLFPHLVEYRPWRHK